MASHQETRAPAPRQSAVPSERRPVFGPMSPFGLIRRMFDDMDRLFEEFGFGAMMPRIEIGRGAEGVWSPQVDVFEREGRLCVRADLPGVRKEDLDVEIRDNMLCLEGQRKQESEERREGYYRSERMYGSFARAIPLPEGVDPEQAQAKFENGVLEVTVPLPPESRTRRRIQIQSGPTPGAPGAETPYGGEAEKASQAAGGGKKAG
jgi:HSP20 family protein